MSDNQLTIGIDPGLTGGIALTDGYKLYQCVDMPVLAINGKKQVNTHQLIQLFGAWSHQYDIGHCYIERAQGAGGQGASAVFNYGMGYGIVLASLVASGIRYTPVAPTKWKRLANLSGGASKKASLELAIALFPQKCLYFTRQKDHGRAEASIIAALGAHGKLDK